MTEWIDARLDFLAQRIGDHIADRIIARTGLDQISDHLGAFLLGVNGTINQMFVADD